MDERQLARFLNGGRVLVGLASLVAPGKVGRIWVGEPATSPEAKLITRAFGVRDLAVGLGTLEALSSGESPSRWLRMGVLCDGGDTAATLAALPAIGLRRALPVLAVAVSAAVTGMVVADRVD